jgi:CO/xanthine dehydrogenase Mo-binding subunit
VATLEAAQHAATPTRHSARRPGAWTQWAQSTRDELADANLADYLVPVNADVPDLTAIYVNGRDDAADPIGVKGLGEVVLVSVAPAIANAVFHATARRVRELPITVKTLLSP